MKHRIVSAILALTSAFSLTACGNGEENKENTRDILIVGTSRDPGLLDPNETNLQMVQAVNKQIYETLFSRGLHSRGTST